MRKGPSIVWEGSLGLDSFEEPIEEFPLERKSDFTHERPLRSYDKRIEDHGRRGLMCHWPQHIQNLQKKTSMKKY